jgi:hypothetical protein
MTDHVHNPGRQWPDPIRKVQVMTFANAITIERPRRDVYWFLAHFENIPTWNYAIVETHAVSDDPVAVGKIYRQIRSMPYRAEETFEITTFEPDLALEIEGKFGSLHGTFAYELEDHGFATLLTNTVHLEARGLAKIAAARNADRLRQAVAANLGTLKEVLEGSPDGTERVEISNVAIVSVPVSDQDSAVRFYI